MPRKKVASEVTPAVTGEVLTNRQNQHTQQYQEGYGELAIRFFADMLEAGGERLRDAEKEVESSLAERGLIAKDDGRKRRGRGPLLINERRKHKEKEWRWVMAEIPSFEKLARHIGVCARTLKVWRRLYPSFDDALEQCRDMAADALLQRGLRGQYPAEMVKFVGTNWLGLTDRKEITGAEGAPLNPPEHLRFVSVETLDSVQAMLLEARRQLLALPK